MIRPSEEVVRGVVSLTRQYPAVLDFLEAWRMHELEQLPFTQNNPALQQGRCQVLGELVKFAKNAPDNIAAKS